MNDERGKFCYKCEHWIPGYIEDNDNFVPPRCVIHNEPKHATEYCKYFIQIESDKGNIYEPSGA